jgi:glucose dehydrogenase
VRRSKRRDGRCDNSLIFCSPFNEVIAVDPGSGAQKWRYDPRISTSQRLARQGETPSLWSRTVDRPGGRFWSKVIMRAIVPTAVIALWRWHRRAALRS